jgi:hypothetical protein
MRPLPLALVLLSGCATTPFAKVKEAKTIEAARALLDGYEPSITPYPPNAEAWYFGRNECVLFVDGKVRLSKSSETTVTYSDGKSRKLYNQKQVACAPSQLSAD